MIDPNFRFTRCNYGYQNKEDEMAEKESLQKPNMQINLIKIIEIKDHFGHLDVEGNIIVRCFL
jgi:hypothetical protein